MKNYEKKSFLTTVFLFLIPLVTFATLILYMYHADKVKDIEQNILYQMKDYTFDFQDDTFNIDVIQDEKQKELFKIYHCKEGLCAYFHIPSTVPYLLKVIYPKEKYEKIYRQFLFRLLKISIFVFFCLLVLSVAFALYALRPMQEALHLLEDFLKDLIHDLNTPATSILLNSKLLKKRGDYEEIERIELSAKSIASLYKNLEFMSPSTIQKDETIFLEDLVQKRVEILQKIYPQITFKKNLTPLSIQSNKNGIERILDNLLSNACKYNKQKGEVHIRIYKNMLIIEDTGIGIKNTKKIFQRYYKEGTNGLGLGMNIVKRLCEILNIDIDIKSEINKGTKITLRFT